MERVSLGVRGGPPHNVCGGEGGQEGMGGDWKRDTLLDPLISPLSPPHCFIYNGVGGGGGQGRVRDR